jgi:hypothetical protein
MFNLVAEKLLTRLLMVGSAFISIFVMWGTVTDPVNVTKLLALGGVAGAAIAITASFQAKQIWSNYKALLITLFCFFLSVINSALQSGAPVSQLVYGTYGRNTGLVTYLLLILLNVSVLGLSQKTSFLKISYGLLAAGLINVIYCLWVITVGDFIGWSNPYGNILGTFGNPNFIGAFLGMFVSVLFAFLIKPNLGLIYRVVGLAVLIVALVEIKSSHAIQGIVVAAGGISLVGFYFLRSKFNSKLIPAIYSAVVLLVGLIATLGALQIGPLTKLIYKNSVSLRGEYWQAAWNMGSKFPFSGVGMDTYGDWYRRLRDDHALINPGPGVISNAAHSVVMDQFAYGGWPMLITYLAVLVLVVIAIVKVSIRRREFDFTFIGLAVAWICYQVQSLISINQIGLAIWGWLLGGAVIAYERTTRAANEDQSKSMDSGSKKNRASAKQGFGLSPTMVGVIGGVIGLLIATPPYSADTKWKSALGSGSIETVEQALTPSYLNPVSSFRYASASQLFESNKLYDQAYKYAKIAIKFNPDSFDAWNMLYYIQKSTQADRDLAKQNLVRLDPKNKELFNVPKQ